MAKCSSNVYVRDDTHKKLKIYAAITTQQMSDIVDSAINAYIDNDNDIVTEEDINADE